MCIRDRLNTVLLKRPNALLSPRLFPSVVVKSVATPLKFGVTGPGTTAVVCACANVVIDIERHKMEKISNRFTLNPWCENVS